MLLVKKGIYESHWNKDYDEVAMFLKMDEPRKSDVCNLPVQDHVVTVRPYNENIDEAVTGETEDIKALVTFHMDGNYPTNQHPSSMSDESFLWYIARQDKGYYDTFKDKPEFTTTLWKAHCDKPRCGEYARTFFALDIAIDYAKNPTCGHDNRLRIHRVVTHKVMLPELSETVEDIVYGTIQRYAGTERRLYTVKPTDKVKHKTFGEGEVISIIEDGDVTTMRILWDDRYYGISNHGVFGSNVTTLDDKPLYQVI